MRIYCFGINLIITSVIISTGMASLLGDAFEKTLSPNGISRLDREFPSRSLRKSEESRTRLAVDQEIETASYEKRFL